MNKLLTMILVITTFSAHANEITPQKLSQLFKNFEGCFILYDLNKHKIVSEYNPNHCCNQRIAPNSTFKIAISLMAFDQGVINQDTVFKWDGKKREFSDWNHNLTPKTWLQYSALWVSQLLTPKLGYDRIKHYLADFKYGNQNFTGDPGKNNGLERAWVSSSLKISALEQLHFLKSMLSHHLSVSNEAVDNTKENLHLGKLDNGADYYGKTGSGWHQIQNKTQLNKLREGWFVGFIERDKQQYIFVSNLTDRTQSKDQTYGGLVIKPITLKLLNAYFENNPYS